MISTYHRSLRHLLLALSGTTCTLTVLVASVPVQGQQPAAQANGQQNAQAQPAQNQNQAQPAAPAAAPANYETIPVHPTLEKDRALVNRTRNEINQVVLGTGTFDQGKFLGYYTRYLFPKMTQPAYFAELSDNRLAVLRSIQQSRSSQVHDYLRDLTFTFMQPIVRGNYHPYARYNAMLLIAELNETEASLGGQRLPARPMPAALSVMVQEFQNPDQLDAVRIAALQGILRHALADRDLQRQGQGQSQGQGQGQLIGQAGKEAMRQMMLDFVTAEPPAERGAEAHAWMQRRAIDVLAALGDPGPNGEVAGTLNTLVANTDQPLSVRLTAARAMGKLNYANAQTVPAGEAVYNLGTLAAQACRQELARLEDAKTREKIQEQIKSSPGSTYGAMAGGYPGGGMDDYGSDYTGGSSGESYEDMYSSMDMYGGYGMPAAAEPEEEPEDPKLTNTRRRVKHWVYNVQQGLGTGQQGLTSLANTPQSKRIKDAVDAVMTVTEKGAADVDAFMTDLQQKVQALEAVARQAAPAPATTPADELPPDNLPSANLPG